MSEDLFRNQRDGFVVGLVILIQKKSKLFLSMDSQTNTS
ncbi:hypothetical protein PHOSAC3_150174 [Mesotoga infera]|nr:hypothetical protein PHOSAC3_150174 [Mesotoga infera]